MLYLDIQGKGSRRRCKRVIEWFKAKISGRYESKHDILGPGAKHQKSIRVLNRVLSWTSDGIEYEADQRHADIVVSELGLKEAKPVKTPGEDAQPWQENGGEAELSYDMAGGTCHWRLGQTILQQTGWTYSTLPRGFAEPRRGQHSEMDANWHDWRYGIDNCGCHDHIIRSHCNSP